MSEQKPVRLTAREWQLLWLAATGHTNAVMASKLALSPHTIRNYWMRIMAKLDAHSRVEAVLCAMREAA